MLDRLALGGIWAYQRWLSPRKGYRCAHAVLHGGTGCSGYAKYAIRDHGLLRAIPLVRHRFRACRDALAVLQQNNVTDAAAEDRKKRRSTRRDCACDACTAASCDAPGSCGPRKTGGTGASRGCDVGPGGCDGPGPCDCDVCSCG